MIEVIPIKQKHHPSQGGAFHIEVWCSDSTTGFESVGVGLIPTISANRHFGISDGNCKDK